MCKPERTWLYIPRCACRYKHSFLYKHTASCMATPAAEDYKPLTVTLLPFGKWNQLWTPGRHPYAWDRQISFLTLFSLTHFEDNIVLLICKAKNFQAVCNTVFLAWQHATAVNCSLSPCITTLAYEGMLILKDALRRRKGMLENLQLYIIFLSTCCYLGRLAGTFSV